MSDPNWTDVTVAITASFGTVAAIAAGVFSFKQLGEARRSREASLLPTVHVASGERWVGGSTHIPFENVGPGPALEIKVRMWFEQIAGDGTDKYEFDRVSRVLASRSARDPHDEEFYVGALAGNGGRDTKRCSLPNQSTYPGWYMVRCIGTYRDVFDHNLQLDAMIAIEPVQK